MKQTSPLGSIDIAVLAGGLGTRLSSVLPDAPKIMAPVRGRPFLDVVLQALIRQGAHRVVLCLGFKAHVVLAYLAMHSYPPLEIQISVEPSPLGTAGALAFAGSALRSDPVMVMNGDTWTEASLAEFLNSHVANQAPVSILCVNVNDPRRYGSVDISDSGRVVRFEEKASQRTGPGWVNAGVYLLNRQVLMELSPDRNGSIERNVFEKMPPGLIHAHRSPARFLDIGTPESLQDAATVIGLHAGGVT